MSRLPELTPETMTDTQRRALDHLRTALPGAGTNGTFGVWLRLPEIGPASTDLFVATYKHRKLDRRLFELMTIIIARQWETPFAWAEHAGRARDLAISPDVIEAIRQEKEPSFAEADERLVYDVVIALGDAHRLDDALFAHAHALLCEERLVELVMQIGLYTLVASTLAAFAIPARDGNKAFD